MTGLTWTPPRIPPAEPGWYAVELRHSDKPIVLWWRSEERGWRFGAIDYGKDVVGWMQLPPKVRP